jgi:hypothetical protein
MQLQEAPPKQDTLKFAMTRHCPNCHVPMARVPGTERAFSCDTCRVLVGLDKGEERYYKDA